MGRILGARLILAFSLFAFASGIAAADKVIFKRLPAAILKIDEKQVKLWEVYQAEKRGHLVLVQLGRRYLLLETKEKEVFEIDPSAVQQKTKENELVLVRSSETETRLESEVWSMRSVGPAVAIKVRLTAEGRLLELQLPRLLKSGWFY